MYCVVKNTTTVIDQQEDNEIMFVNANKAGYAESDVEILTDLEYEIRKSNEPVPSEQEIVNLKTQLTETDYKIIKCSEYQLAGQELPYDILTLHTERQTLRDRINELELILI